MTNVSEWSVTAGLNNSSPPNGWPEGMARSAVNDCAREMMAALAKWYQDSNGSLVTAGTGNAYTLATNSVYTALNDIPVLVFRTNRANTGAATLTVDSLAATPLRRVGAMEFGSGEIANGQLMVVAYNSSSGEFETVGPAASFATGTLMLFQQTTAPSGWTKQVTHDDKALRVVTGTASSGGTGGTFSADVWRCDSSLHTNLPNVNFSNSLSVGTGITFTTPSGATSCVSSGGAGASGWTSGGTGGSITLAAHLNSGGVSGTVSSGGGDTPLDFNVQYVDVIIAAKA